MIRQFSEYFASNTALQRAAITELRGKHLACWCAPKPCHADVLLRFANSTATATATVDTDGDGDVDVDVEKEVKVSMGEEAGKVEEGKGKKEKEKKQQAQVVSISRAGPPVLKKNRF